jgi:hypothetical protein
MNLIIKTQPNDALTEVVEDELWIERYRPRTEIRPTDYVTDSIPRCIFREVLKNARSGDESGVTRGSTITHHTERSQGMRQQESTYYLGRHRVCLVCSPP